MDRPKDLSGLDHLIACWVDGEATEENVAALEQHLDGNVEAQRRYVHYLDLHAELGQRSGGFAERSVSIRAASAFSWSKQGAWVAFAAAVLVAAGFLLFNFPGSRSADAPKVPAGNGVADSDPAGEQTDSGIAVLTHAIDVIWAGENKPRLDAILSPGTLRMSAGVIQLELYNGVQVIVEGPADLDLDSVASVVCREGKLRAIIPPGATGFRVLTPEFELVDRGTEFAVDVTRKGRSSVHVFDGQVELYQPDGKRQVDQRRVLVGGEAMEWSSPDVRSPIRLDTAVVPSFEGVRIRDRSNSQQRYAAWKRWNNKLKDDPRIVARYDFESSGATLQDASPSQSHGTIVGCEWVAGRWPEKRALAFTRPGDRVRVDVPGEFDAITVAAWIRLDALPSRRQSLLLSDGFDLECLHWQIGPAGELRVGTRIPGSRGYAVGYASAPLFTVRQFGVWAFICSVYDREEGKVRHWFNGELVYEGTLQVDQPIRIGAAEIGNWGAPLHTVEHPIRNFIGRMDELTIWGIALNEDQISEMHAISQPRRCRRNAIHER